MLADATYFDSSAVEPPPDKVVATRWVVERAYERPVVMPVLSTGRWASVLRLLERHGYTGPVFMAGRSLHRFYSLVQRFRQRREDADFYPARTRVPAALVSGEVVESRLESGVPGVYMVAGGMVQSTLAQRLVNIALRRGDPVVVSASQLPGTPGARLLREGRLYRLRDPILRGHMLPEEWVSLLRDIEDLMQADIVVAPIHTSRGGALRFVETVRDHGFYVPRFEVLAAGDVDVIRLRMGRAVVMSGIAPEEPEDWRKDDRIVLRYRAVYDPSMVSAL